MFFSYHPPQASFTAQGTAQGTVPCVFCFAVRLCYFLEYIIYGKLCQHTVAILFNLVTPQAYIELRSNISKRSYIEYDAYITRRKANKTQLAAGKHHSALSNITVL